MSTIYDEKYRTEGYYWGKRPSSMCYKLLSLMPPEKPLRLLDIGCGEGRNAIFFARYGYHVTAFDLSPRGVEKSKKWAEEIGVSVHAFTADLLEYRLQEPYDVLFSTGTLHYIPGHLREEIVSNYKQFTNPNGLHVFSVFVHKPFIARAPDAEASAHLWKTGELFTHYHDWKVEFCAEEIFDCRSSGVPHQHAVNRIIARKLPA